MFYNVLRILNSSAASDWLLPASRLYLFILNCRTTSEVCHCQMPARNEHSDWFTIIASWWSTLLHQTWGWMQTSIMKTWAVQLNNGCRPVANSKVTRSRSQQCGPIAEDGIASSLRIKRNTAVCTGFHRMPPTSDRNAGQMPGSSSSSKTPEKMSDK